MEEKGHDTHSFQVLEPKGMVKSLKRGNVSRNLDPIIRISLGCHFVTKVLLFPSFLHFAEIFSLPVCYMTNLLGWLTLPLSILCIPDFQRNLSMSSFLEGYIQLLRSCLLFIIPNLLWAISCIFLAACLSMVYFC